MHYYAFMKEKLVVLQQSELTEHIIYSKLADINKNQNNKKILLRISGYEKKHHDIFAKMTGQTVKPKKTRIWLYMLISRIFGLTFGLELMKNRETLSQNAYRKISVEFPKIKKLIDDEERHKEAILKMIEEEKLKYIGSVVLGLSDALIGLTGTLAGTTLAFQNGKLIAVGGLITGIAASISMSVSEYLSTNAEKSTKSPLKASIYTGTAYVTTVSLLIFPFFTLSNLYLALSLSILDALIVIFIFTFYNSVVQGSSFKKNFLRMAFLIMGVSSLTFGIGYMLRSVIKIDI